MSAVATAAEPVAAQSGTEEPPRTRWRPATRIAFRFTFLYFGLFCLVYPQPIYEFVGWFGTWLPDDAVLWQARVLEPVLSWVGRTVFGADVRLHFNGSGDQGIFWVLLFCLLVIAVAGTLIWTLLDRRPEYRRLSGWFLLFLRLCVAGQMVNYGLAKVIPTQMPEPALSTLLEPYGNQPPFAVLWNQVGVSPVYEILLGSAELLAGLLLFIPRTAVLGAMLTLVSMAQVFLLNMTFGVPVKILSGHLLLMSLVLLAPEARRLTAALVLNRATGPSTMPYPFRTVRSRRIAAWAQVALGIWVTASVAHLTWGFWQESGPDRPKPALYGIWSVSEFTRDGQPVAPLLTDENRWRTVVVDYPGMISYQRMDGTMVTVPGTVDAATHRMEITGGPQQPAALTFEQPAPDRAVLAGDLSGHPVTITLQRVDPDSFPLRSTKFRWVQDAPAE
ncbi:DoxX family protein [Nocardia wallacei]|uniref:DoxX family protein n=1 Tax=Nocardia wallacei TaxID=480035 RepID=UPI00245399FC|nr:DoxX family protein [Nocardia wallacei]